MEWLKILENLGVFALLAAGVAWLARALFSQMLNRDLERFKSDLEKDAIQYKIRYERLQTERVDVIKEVYKKIVQVHRSIRSLLNPFQYVGQPTEQEKVIEATNKNIDLISYFEENRVFFEEKLAEDIDSLLTKFNEIWMQFEGSRNAKRDDDFKDARQRSDKAWKQINEDVPIVKGQLENEFRGILGIENK
ncbi:MAG: hypothetical protein KAT79_00895 [candidate division Zixibacteria bacterium]|nr:hypothetical protein [candidate division Zixibacteria bacterium]